MYYNPPIYKIKEKERKKECASPAFVYQKMCSG